MAIKKYKPTSPARRFMTVSAYEEITSTTPERSLLVSLNKSGGRNSMGRITVRHIGGGNRNKYRIIDYKRNKDGIPGKSRFHRIRPQPFCKHRASALCGRRKEIHPCSFGLERRRRARKR